MTNNTYSKELNTRKGVNNMTHDSNCTACAIQNSGETVNGNGASFLYDLGNNEAGADLQDESFVSAHTPVTNYQVLA